MTEEEKILDEILQLYLPDEYYQDQRAKLIPHLIWWKNKKNKRIKKQVEPHGCNYELINDVFKCTICGQSIGQWLNQEAKKGKIKK